MKISPRESVIFAEDFQAMTIWYQDVDVKVFFAYLQEKGGNITFGPSYDEKGGFWFGGFHDLEGNPFWVVDENCP